MLVKDVVDKVALVSYLQEVVFKQAKRPKLVDANLKRMEKGLRPLEKGEENYIFASLAISAEDVTHLLENFGEKFSLSSNDNESFTFFVKPETEVEKKDGTSFIAAPQISFVQDSRETVNIEIKLNPDTFRTLS